MWQHFIQTVSPTIITAVVTLIGALFAYFGRHFPSIIKVWFGKTLYDQIENQTVHVVKALAQTFVQPLKDAGTWNAQSALQAKNKAVQDVKDALPAFLKIGAKLLHMDLAKIIPTYIESAVFSNPTKSTKPAPQQKASGRKKSTTKKTA